MTPQTTPTIFTTTSAAETQALAAQLASRLRGGEVIELVSDLGGGKTTFVQGLAAALGYTGRVMSPTFTLSNVYELPGGCRVVHYDLYRLSEGGVVGEELFDEIADPHVITVVEWAGVIDAGLPVDRLTVVIAVTGDEARTVAFTAGGEVSGHLVAGLR